MNAALKRDLSISEGKYKGKIKCKGKYIGKWFLCPKCGIYLLNAAMKRIFSISECKCKYKGKCKGIGKFIGKWFLCPKCGIYLLNAALKRILIDFRMQIQRQMQMQRQMHMKMVFMP